MNTFKNKFIMVFLFLMIILQQSNLQALSFYKKTPKKTCDKNSLIFAGISIAIALEVVFIVIRKFYQGTTGDKTDLDEPKNLTDPIIATNLTNQKVANETSIIATGKNIKVDKNNSKQVEVVDLNKQANMQIFDPKKICRIKHFRGNFSDANFNLKFEWNLYDPNEFDNFVMLVCDFSKDEQKNLLADIPDEVKKELEVEKHFKIAEHKGKVNEFFIRIRNREKIDNSSWKNAQDEAKFYELKKLEDFSSKGKPINISNNYCFFLKEFVSGNKLEMYNLLLKIYEKKNSKYDGDITREDFNFANDDKEIDIKDFDKAKALYLEFINHNVFAKLEV